MYIKNEKKTTENQRENFFHFTPFTLSFNLNKIINIHKHRQTKKNIKPKKN